MKPNRNNRQNRIQILALLMLGVLPMQATEPKQTGTTAATEALKAIEIPVSVFKDDLSGDDPFFPGAEYRKQQKPVESNQQSDSEALRILKQLELTGFGGIKNRRWAMVNGQSLYTGEAVDVVISGRPYKILCVEVKERSVVLSIKGSTTRHEIVIE